MKSRMGKTVMYFKSIDKVNIFTATGGIDRILRYWNPYVPGKPIAVSSFVHKNCDYFMFGMG